MLKIPTRKDLQIVDDILIEYQQAYKEWAELETALNAISTEIDKLEKRTSDLKNDRMTLIRKREHATHKLDNFGDKLLDAAKPK